MYLNRLIIEENMQFECYGVLDPVSIIPFETTNYIISLNEILWMIDKAIVHVIISDDFGLKSYRRKVALSRFDKFLKLLWLLAPNEIMITRIGSQRLECVQKEQYQNFYRLGGQVNTIQTNHFHGAVDVSKYKTIVYQSVGDDIEEFYNHIKMNRIYLINPTEETIYLTRVMLQKILSLDPFNSSKLIVRSFHLSMLTDQEENEMDYVFLEKRTNR